jgi:hypothetical protein
VLHTSHCHACLRSGGVRRTFLPVERIAAVVINEAVTTTRVFCYLAVALHGEQLLTLPFAALQPRLRDLVAPYRAANALVFGEDAPPPAWPTQEDADAIPRLPDTLFPSW